MIKLTIGCKTGNGEGELVGFFSDDLQSCHARSNVWQREKK